MMSDVFYTDPNGKNWRVVGVRDFKDDDFVVDSTGIVYKGSDFGISSVAAIVEPVAPPRRVPTDQDALKRPKCWVRDGVAEQWRQGVLYGVVPTEYQFVVIASQGRPFAESYKECEIESE